MSFAFDPKSELPLVLGGNVFGWTADRDESFAVLDAFLAAGGSQIDTADSYMWRAPGNSGGESETIIGDWLASRGCREQIFLATKVGSLPPYDNLRAGTIIDEVENSLRRLRTDHIDLYWAHKDDAGTPQEETLAAFNRLVADGKVRFLGASNFSAERLASALALPVSANYVAVQPHYNLLEHAEWEQGAGRVALAHGLATWPYYGLAAGFLTGKYRPGNTDVESARAGSVAQYFTGRGWRTLSALDEIAAAHAVSPAAVALRWLAQQPGVLAPIASARTPQQLTDLLGVGRFELAEPELTALRAAASGADDGS
ncbi:MAG TPA: aldo/keto reductase [Jatrophihabitans sp.]|nr:aldo/keto reductase [Jatrophihabitans sp.]